MDKSELVRPWGAVLLKKLPFKAFRRKELIKQQL